MDRLESKPLAIDLIPASPPEEAPAKFTWTEGRVMLLRLLHADSKSTRDIAKAIGAARPGYDGRNMVIGKIHRLGLGKRSPHLTKRIRREAQLNRPPRPPGKWSLDRTRTNNGSRSVPKPSLALLTALQPLRLSLPIPGPIQIKPLGEPASLLERHDAGCSWAIESNCRSHIFCNAHKLKGRPYCPLHHSQSYTRLLPSISACLPRRRG